MKLLLRYTLVGAIATAAHYALLIVCVEVGHWPAWGASGFGAVVGSQVAFLGNWRYTFGYRGSLGRSWVKFHATALAGAALGMAIVGGAVHIGLHYLIGQLVATLASLLLTFTINRLWSFR
ncbi:MAG: GtrA family protein [Burkholderiales bacterium]